MAGRKIHVLNSKLLPYGSELRGEERVFKQDRDSIHTTIGVKNWFAASNLQVSPCPAKSRDLNIMAIQIICWSNTCQW